MNCNIFSPRVLLVIAACNGFAQAPTEKIDALATSVLTESHSPGISISVVSHGTIVLSTGYGLANVECSTPAGANTAYELLSVGKQFTAAAIMLLVNDHKLSLDDLVPSLLLDSPPEWKSITVRHLLTHTSGIPDYTNVRGWRDSIREDRAPLDLVRSVYGPLLFSPGSAWRYSNTNYYVLGLIIEKLSGMRYAEFLSQRIFAPLAMTNTRVNDFSDVIPHRASGYHWNGHELQNAPYVSPSQKWAAGSVVSTAGDLAKWAVALDRASLLPAPTVAQMSEPARLNNGQLTHYGFGNELEEDHGHRVAGHQGGGLGFNATVLRFPDDQLTVTVLGNLTQTPSRLLASRVAAIFLPNLSDEQNHGIADSDPATTSMLKAVLAAAAQGKADPTLFAADAREQVLPFIEHVGPRFLAPLGDLQSFVLLENREATDRSVRRYRATFAKGKTLIWTFELTKDGKIVSLEPKEE